MNPQRLTVMTPLFQAVALPVCVVAWIAAFGSPQLEHHGVTPFINHIAPSLVANAEVAIKPQTIAAPALAADQPPAMAADTPHIAAISQADIAAANAPMKIPASEPMKEVTTSGTASASHELDATQDAEDQAPFVTAALTDPAERLPTETAAVQAASSGSQAGDVTQPAGTVENLDECYVMTACIDRYLWALYQRTRKEDAVRREDQRKVTIKRRGKLVTVTRTFTTVVDEDFGWKDPKAADKAGLSMPDYVFGGMDQGFKLKLFRMLLAAEQAGLSPGITSGFRDDYRQSIASGLKAASDRSYHGGSFRGGYGHGLAADVVSTRGDTRAARQASSEIFWKWIDTHGSEFGMARPYQDRDPPHVGPIDGQEYADHFRGKRAKTAGTDAKKRSQDDRGETKRRNTARSSKSKNT